MKTMNKSLSVASLQFAACSDIAVNHAAIVRGMRQAAEQGADLLLTQECALCGYPPIESVFTEINFDQLRAAEQQLWEVAKALNIVLFLGTIIQQDADSYNAIRVLHPDGNEREPYAKRALWGWDLDHFIPGTQSGIYELGDVKVGVRICFEVRFPEYFRELFAKDVDVMLIAFCDGGSPTNTTREPILTGHLVTRAVENASWVVTANSTAEHQLVPTCMIHPDGAIVAHAEKNREMVIVKTLECTSPPYGRRGRMEISRELCKDHY
jgi:NAD+ synthase (glutamine-hydrolysing)